MRIAYANLAVFVGLIAFCSKDKANQKGVLFFWLSFFMICQSCRRDMNTLPLFFNLRHKTVLVVGGSDVALRKATLLYKSGAKIVIVAKTVHAKLYELLADDNHQIKQKSYDSHDLDGVQLVIVATDDKDLNEQIYHDAHRHNIMVNVVDTPNLCDFIFPAIVDRSPIVVGITSNGNAPVLARLIRAKIESVLPSHVGQLANLSGQFRQLVKNSLTNINQRRQFWERIFDRQLNEQGQSIHSLSNLQAELDDFAQNHQPTGEVYIVGVGAGSADLLTFKALRLMQQADVVLYDALIPSDIVDLCRRDSDKIFVGKKRHNHTKNQDEINALLVDLAKQGKRVLRLKGGDPFIFGRGGEEMQACQKADVPYTVVSGITSALAAASGAGIALTYRGVATSVRFLTACFGNNAYLVDLQGQYRPDETLVFYMGLSVLDKLVAHLRNSGLDETTPIAIISCASLPTQQVLAGTLANISQKQSCANLPAPAIIIVGAVVGIFVDIGE